MTSTCLKSHETETQPKVAKKKVNSAFAFLIDGKSKETRKLTVFLFCFGAVEAGLDAETLIRTLGTVNFGSSSLNSFFSNLF